jgi:hypothetical protein
LIAGEDGSSLGVAGTQIGKAKEPRLHGRRARESMTSTVGLREAAMAIDGSDEPWRPLIEKDRELARDALRVLEGMHPCKDDAKGVENAKGHLRAAIEGLSEALRADIP